MKKTYNAPQMDVLCLTASDEVLTTVPDTSLGYNEEVGIWE